MAIPSKPDRAALKNYFIKNAIPTEANFASLIDNLINQQDDGIVRESGGPISIQADTLLAEKLIDFYKSFTDVGPTWTLGLKSGTSNGLNIDDANSNSRLFIDETTGHIGIGTVDPTANLEVSGDIKVEGVWNSNKDVASNLTNGGNLVIKSDVPQIDFISTNYIDWAIHVGQNKMYFIQEPWMSDQLVLDGGTGYIGIGTAFPAAKLQVTGGAIMPAVGNSAVAGILFPGNPGGGLGDSAWLRYYARDGEACTLEMGIANDGDDNIALMASGGVGIGTLSPIAPLHVAGYKDTAFYLEAVMDIYGARDVANALSALPHSIVADQRVRAGAFDVNSDMRVKVVTGKSNNLADLNTLMNIHITDFTFKDVIGKGNKPHKKVIAQQVEEVYPLAVNMITDVLPDIYQSAEIEDGWILLETDLEIGDRIKLIASDNEGIYEVTEVRHDRFRTEKQFEAEKVFVFGREVDDFRVLDYDAIAMLNVSATQQVKKELDAGIKALRDRYMALSDRLDSLEIRDIERDEGFGDIDPYSI